MTPEQAQALLNLLQSMDATLAQIEQSLQAVAHGQLVLCGEQAENPGA